MDWMDMNARMHCRPLYALPAVLWLVLASSCGDDPSGPEPFQPDFFLASISFTGDSVDSSGERTEAIPTGVRGRTVHRGDPYCEVTVSWHPPEGDSALVYTLYRSTTAGIRFGGKASVIIGNTSDTLFSDSIEMSWGAEYHYAVSALTSDSTKLWSDEDSIMMPSSPMPTPSVLSATDLPMGRCILTWTACPDVYFQSYTLLRFELPFSMERDTLMVSTVRSDTVFIDSVIPAWSPRLYQVITEGRQGLTSVSNTLEYSSSLEIPYRMDQVWVGPGDIASYTMSTGLTASLNNEFIYFDESQYSQYPPYPTYNRTRRMRTDCISSQAYFCIDGYNSHFSVAPQQNAILHLDMLSESSCIVRTLDEETLEPLDSFNIGFECDAVLALNSGGMGILHQSFTSWSLALHIPSMTLQDTLDYAFTAGRVVEGFGTYILPELRRIDPVTLEIVASSSIVPITTSITGTSSGDLCCISTSGVFYRLDPLDLSVIESAYLPFMPYSATLLEADGHLYAYLWDDAYATPQVYDTDGFTFVGAVLYDENMDDIIVTGMTPLPLINDICCAYFNWDNSRQGVFTISR